MWEVLQKIDTRLFYMINQNGQNAFFDFLMPVISNIKNFYILLGILWALMVLKKGIKYRIVAILILMLIAVSDRVNSAVLKPAFNRPRPYHSISGVHLYNGSWRTTPELKDPIVGRSYAFPSTHATNLFACALFLGYHFRKFWPFFYLIAFLVGYSRVYLGVHFPLDVLGGVIVGTLFGLGFIWISNHLIKHYENKFGALES